MATQTLETRQLVTDFGAIEIGWDGRPLAPGCLAVDTETEMIEQRDRIPRLVMMSVSDGKRHLVIPPDQVADFLSAHRERVWIAHNWAFDFWVLHQTLPQPDYLWAKAANGQLRDSMLLARLINLAETGDTSSKKLWSDVKLETLANRLTNLKLNKEADAKYRENYAQLLNRDRVTVEDDWFIYAARDAVAT